MSLPNMDDELSYEDLGHLLVAKGEKLERGEDDPEEVIRSVMENLSRAKNVRPREKTVDPNGRVSVGRDLSGTLGLTLYHPDAEYRDGDDGGEDGDA